MDNSSSQVCAPSSPKSQVLLKFTSPSRVSHWRQPSSSQIFVPSSPKSSVSQPRVIFLLLLLLVKLSPSQMSHSHHWSQLVTTPLHRPSPIPLLKVATKVTFAQPHKLGGPKTHKTSIPWHTIRARETSSGIGCTRTCQKHIGSVTESNWLRLDQGCVCQRPH